MFYVGSVIIFSIFPQLLKKSTLLVRYKLNRFRSPRVNQFDFLYCYSQDTPGSYCQIKGSYIFSVNLHSGSSSVSQLDLTLFPLCNGILFQSLKISSRNNSNSVICYMCFNYRLSRRNIIIILTPNDRIKHSNDLSCDTSQ